LINKKTSLEKSWDKIMMYGKNKINKKNCGDTDSNHVPHG
jgi:hypothetical protein